MESPSSNLAGFQPSLAAFNDKLLFSCESPLFAKSVSDYGKELMAMTQYLQSITKTMKMYIQQVKKMSEVGESMASKIRVGFPHAPHDANSESIMITARSIADIISDISQSQEILALTLEQSFVDPIDSLCATEVNKTMQIQHHYQVLRETNEAIIMKYIQADGQGKSVNAQTLDARAYEMALQKRRFELGRYDMVQRCVLYSIIIFPHSVLFCELANQFVYLSLNLCINLRTFLDYFDNTNQYIMYI